MSTPARILMVEGDTVPPAPTLGQVLLYAKTNNTFYSLNSLGVETPLGGGGGGVTSVAATGNNGISVSGSPITGSGTFVFGLGAITPTSVAATGSVTGTNLSGTNTGDQTITLTGDVTGSGTGSFATILANSGVTAGIYGSGTLIPVVTVDAKGRITAISTTAVSGGGSGTVTSVGATGSSDITVGGAPITTSGTLTFALSNTAVTANTYGSATQVPVFTVDAKGRITGVTNTTITGGAGSVTSVSVNGTGGRITSSGSPITTSGTITLDLATSGVTANTYGSATQVPVFTVDTFGRVTSVTNTTITGGAGSVTSVGATGSSDITVGGAPITTSGTLTFALSNTAVTANTYGSATQVPVFAVDAKGRITGVTNTTITAGAGSVTSVGATGSADITVGGAPITTSGTLTFALSNTAVTANTYGSATQVPVFTVDAKGRITGVTNTTITGGAGSVTSVGASGTQGVTIGGSPITTSGTITVGLGAITPTSVAATGTMSGSNLSGTNTGDQTSVTGNAGTATTLQTGRTLAITGDLAWTSPTFDGSANVTAAGTLATVNGNVGSFGSATQVPVFTVNAKGLVTAVSNVTISGGGSGTVTSVGATGSADITVGGSPITTSGTLTFALSNTAVTANTYGSATQVPVFAVDAKGRITGVTNTTITGGGSSTPEIVVFNYSAGGSGNFTPVDAIFSQTSGVTATVTDGANCIATYAFTGKSNPPKSVTTYGQVFSTNEFTIKDTTSLPSAKVAGGGSAAAPAIRTGFTASNIVTLQTRMSDTGTAAGLGQRAWLMVVFGF